MTFEEWWKESLAKGAVSSDEKEIAEYAFEAGQKDSEAQIEKMKCCENCLYKGFGRNFEGRCNIQGHIIKNPFEEKCEEWEIKEK